MLTLMERARRLGILGACLLEPSELERHVCRLENLALVHLLGTEKIPEPVEEEEEEIE